LIQFERLPLRKCRFNQWLYHCQRWRSRCMGILETWI